MQPPSSFGGLHLISTQLEDASTISRGPSGGVGLSKWDMLNVLCKAQYTTFLMNIDVLTYQGQLGLKWLPLCQTHFWFWFWFPRCLYVAVWWEVDGSHPPWSQSCSESLTRALHHLCTTEFCMAHGQWMGFWKWLFDCVWWQLVWQMLQVPHHQILVDLKMQIQLKYEREILYKCMCIGSN